MEIIQSYKSDDDTEVCVISDGSTIYFADKNDLEVEAASVGTIVRPSQMKEAYLEIPKELLQEAARRSEVAVDPDPEEDSEDSGGDSEEEENPSPPDWKPIALERFLQEYTALDRGVDVRVVTAINLKVRWSDDEYSSWELQDGATDLGSILDEHDALQQNLRNVTERIQTLCRAMEEFASQQRDLGNEISDSDVQAFVDQEHQKQETTQQAAE